MNTIIRKQIASMFRHKFNLLVIFIPTLLIAFYSGFQLKYRYLTAATCKEETNASDHRNGFATFIPGKNSIIVYVSSSLGNDANDGSSPQKAVKTLNRASGLVRDGHNDFMLLRRGDTWRGESLGRFKSGLNAARPQVVGSYGESCRRPRLELNGHFIDHDGQSRSFVAISGLQIVSYPKIPGDSSFNGATGGGVRYVGGGTSLLIEDCHILYGELIIQSYGKHHYEKVKIRRNIIEYNYHVNTCGQNAAYRPSGMYASHVKDLTIENNIFDHNGWNEKVASACATMYNHNMYLNANRLVVRENIITRASSMGIKMRSDTTGDANCLLFENNLLVGGEIGLSIGGNTKEKHRFSNVTIRNNVFTQIGKCNPTKRNFSWMLDVEDNNNTIIENNYFLHQPWYTNAYGIRLGGNSTSNIEIRGNLFYNIKQRSLYILTRDSWERINIYNNTVVDHLHDSCLVEHQGAFKDVAYHGNRYYSSNRNNWFCINGSRYNLAQWSGLSGEKGAVSWVGKFSDPDRTVGSYAATLELGDTLEGFISAAKKQSRCVAGGQT
jgi:hypothetical protein